MVQLSSGSSALEVKPFSLHQINFLPDQLPILCQGDRTTFPTQKICDTAANFVKSFQFFFSLHSERTQLELLRNAARGMNNLLPTAAKEAHTCHQYLDVVLRRKACDVAVRARGG